MYTSIVLVALISSADAKVAAPKAPAWLTDYSAARQRGVEKKLPLAVVIGNGPKGWEAVAQGGKFDPSVAETLLSSYVCVYVDATLEQGQKMADAFQMKSGLILSDRSGEKQAFRYEGSLTNGDLDSVLKRFSIPDRLVNSTETQVQSTIRNYPYEGAPTGAGVPTYLAPASGGSYCPSCRGR